ncbi:MAG: tetratricopeptide repeat protein [Phycisphaerales bacterium]
MAWFSRKKDGDDASGDSGLEIQPEKARAWFDQARVAADTRNYDYAITCYLSGIKFDPTNVDMHQRLFEAASLYRSTGGKPASGREVREMSSGSGSFGKVAAAELAWVKDATDPNLALKFMQQASQHQLFEVAYWAGEKGLVALARSKKVTKSMLIGFLDIFEQIGAYQKAVELGDVALRMDQTDANLMARVRDLSAKAAMDKGKYDQNIGEEGSFRGSIKDADAQKELVEDESLAVGQDAATRRLARAKEEYEAQPESPDTIQKYAELLRKQSDDASQKEAIRVLMAGFKSTSEYRFRASAGDIKLTIERRKLRGMRDAAEASGDPEDQAKVERAERAINEFAIKEFSERVEKYPTDLRLKYELGQLLYRNGQYEDAIPHLQQAQEDARIRSSCQHLIGLCFLKTEWYDEAVQSLRAAVEGYELDDDRALEMRYDLMDALERYAREHDDLEAAEEANKLASAIALKQLNFRDIRARRDALRDLMKSLKASS